jgi:V/A-type H+-transporting ATPase subunit C
MSTKQGGSNYEYVTARVRSRRSRLFDEDDYRKLTRMGTGEIARFMEESEYEAEMNALGSRHSGVDLIEYALNRNLAANFDDLLRWADGRLYDYIARYLRKFDAWNVKTTLRGVYSEADRTDVEDDFIRAGEFTEKQHSALLDAASMEEAIAATRGTMFHGPLEAALEVYEESDELVPLENAIDRAFYGHLLDGLPEEPDRPTELYIEFLRAEIDFRNLRNAFRLAYSGADMNPADYFIDGGRLFGEGDLRQLAQTPDELAARVRESPYGDDLDEALDALERARSLIGFENALDAALLEYSEQLSSRYPLSVCPVLGYVLAKEREIDNIRAIARGREAGLSEEEIQDELVIL